MAPYLLRPERPHAGLFVVGSACGALSAGGRDVGHVGADVAYGCVAHPHTSSGESTHLD
jgi:hypothetical protein